MDREKLISNHVITNGVDKKNIIGEKLFLAEHSFKESKDINAIDQFRKRKQRDWQQSWHRTSWQLASS